MAFMRAAISNEPETWIITENDDREILTCLPDGEYDGNLTFYDLAQIAEANYLETEDVAVHYAEALRIANNRDFTIRTGFCGWLSAPGYTDRTSVVVAVSVAWVARGLLEMYFDRPFDEMDDDELEDAEWLSDLCDRADEVEMIRAEIDRRAEAE